MFYAVANDFMTCLELQMSHIRVLNSENVPLGCFSWGCCTSSIYSLQNNPMHDGHQIIGINMLFKCIY